MNHLNQPADPAWRSGFYAGIFSGVLGFVLSITALWVFGVL